MLMLLLPQFRFPSSVPVFCTPHFSFFEAKRRFQYQIFIENQKPVKTSQIYGFVTVCPIKHLAV